jgi:hypothetical protein
MGNAQRVSDFENSLKIDRLLDSEHNIYIGIGNTIANKSSQAIRFGDCTQKCHRLILFSPTLNTLQYGFEDGIIMTLEKRDGDIHLLVYCIDNSININKVMEPMIRKYHKKICYASYELDRIYNFICE